MAERAPAARRPLSRDLVLDAAREQVVEGGLGSLSSRSVAARLNVTPMALYRHVGGMDDLMAAVVDDLLDDSGTPDPELSWEVWLEALALDLRMLLLANPDALLLFNRRPVTTPAARRRVERAIAVLGGAGFGPDGAVQAYAAIHTYTLGFCALEVGRLSAEVADAPLDAPSDPTSLQIHGFVTESQFLVGLRALVSGLGSTVLEA